VTTRPISMVRPPADAGASPSVVSVTPLRVSHAVDPSTGGPGTSYLPYVEGALGGEIVGLPGSRYGLGKTAGQLVDRLSPPALGLSSPLRQAGRLRSPRLFR
jgi:hypothetical protein